MQCAAGQRKELPIFPLNVVALPHAVVPLMIFEARCGPAVSWVQHMGQQHHINCQGTQSRGVASPQ